MNRSSQESPLISVITVTYQAVDTLERTLQSINQQSATNFEYLLMDGASTDGTLELAKSYLGGRAKIFSSPDQGIYDAMNKALDVAQGQYVLFLNAGDAFASCNSLQRFEDAIVKNNFPDVIYGQTMLVDDSGEIIGPRHLTAPDTLSLDSFKKGMVVCHQAFMVKRSLAPLYDIRYRFSADYDWCIRILQNSKENLYLGDLPVIHYLYEGLTTRNHKASLKERFRIMSHYFGLVPTIFRHLGFMGRYISRRNNSINVQ